MRRFVRGVRLGGLGWGHGRLKAGERDLEVATVLFVWCPWLSYIADGIRRLVGEPLRG